MASDPSHNPPASTPPLSAILAWHVVSTVLHYLLYANVLWLMPLLVRLHFGAADPNLRDWQTTFVTAAFPTFMLGSIFWGELLRRIPVRTYLLIFWLTATCAYGAVGIVQSYWQFLACHIVATIGLAGWSPVQGQLLKRLYTDSIRGRAFGVMNAAVHASSLVSIYFVSRWFEDDANAFRIFFPAAAVLQFLSLIILMRLLRHTDGDLALRRRGRWSFGRIIRPVLHMGRTLRADRTFLHYEIAFMTYGASYMMCDALLPVFATARLHMRYEDYAESTQLVLKLVMLIMIVPMGWIMDRMGAVRTSCLAFASLALYPLFLMLAHDTGMVGFATIFYGFGLSGVAMGWLLGPVTLAGTSDKVPQYVAIHATLVGVRGIIFQGLGMLLYKWTGTFVFPLTLSVIGFTIAALLMARLQKRFHLRVSPPPHYQEPTPATRPAAAPPG